MVNPLNPPVIRGGEEHGAVATTRQRLIRTGIDLFYRHGFHAVGLDRILDEVGVTKTTFYKHFDSKDELILAALRQRETEQMAMWLDMVHDIAGDGGPRVELLAMFDALDRWFNEPEFNGCMFINAASEFPGPNEPAHRISAQHKRRIYEEILDRARKLGVEEDEAFAEEMLTLVEGATVLRHVAFDNDAARTARRTAELLMEKYLPAVAGTS